MTRSGASLALLLAGLEELPLRSQTGGPTHPCVLDAGPSFAPFLGNFLGQLEPGSDVFVTEKYAVEVEAILDRWTAACPQAAGIVHAIETCLQTSLTAPDLGKPQIRPLRTQLPLQTEQALFPGAVRRTSKNFVGSLKAYFGVFASVATAQFQVGGIEATGENAQALRTEIFYDVLGTLQDGRREQRTGVWEVQWSKSGSADWLIAAWTAPQESRSRLRGQGFVDVTQAVLGSNASLAQQMDRGADHWRTLLDGAVGIDVYGNNGIAVGDFNGDGHDDVYVCQAAGLPNRLYRNNGDGILTDVTEQAGVGVLDGTSSALFADLNNNGHQDLIVVRTSGPLLFVNQGDGSFQRKDDAFQFARPPQGTFTAAALADYDRDGLLDIYFCLYSYYQGPSEYRFPQPYYDAQNGPPNFLFRNRGDHTFQDVTVTSGMDANNNRYSFACGWNDFDNDGFPDLYVVNDFGRKNLYRNRGDGTFADLSAETGVEDPGAGMSVCWFDYDNDGRDDLYVANMWTAEGRRVSAQKVFLPAAAEPVRRVYRKHATGNSLFHNAAADRPFENVTDASGTRLGGWSWSSDAWDFDHDGYADLYVTNGFVSGAEHADLSSFFWRQVVARSLASGGAATDYEDAWSAINEFLRANRTWSGYERNNAYVNNSNGTFTEAAGVLGIDFLEDGRSFALADLDGDGRLEVLLKNRNAPQLRVLQSRMDPLPPSLTFALRGTRSNRDAIGAVVELSTMHSRQRKTVAAGSGFLAQHTKLLHFGLGTAQPSVGDPIGAAVHWPSGLRQTFERLPAGHRIDIEEGRATYAATPHRVQVIYGATAERTAETESPGTGVTWLVEPVLAPPFTLNDQHGARRDLASFNGKAVMLLFVREDCTASREALAAVTALWPRYREEGVAVVVMGSGNAMAEAASLPFPALSLDDTTGAVYNIFYRFLFERRRDMPLPSALLLDAETKVVLVSSGAVDPGKLLADWHSASTTAEQRLQRACAFPGLYFGEPLHHNYFTYGVAYFRYGYLDQAAESFKQAIAHNAKDAGSFYNLGLIALGKNDVAQARTRLEEAVRLDPANANAWNNLGVVYGRQADYSRAMSSFQQALTLRPQHLLALQNAVKLLKFQGRLDEAESLLRGAIANDPAEVPLLIQLALVEVDRNRLPEARKQFETALALQPNDLQALNGFGVVLMKMGDTTLAETQFQRCLTLAPAFDRPYLNLALLYLRAGDAQKAHDLLAGYLQRQPENADIRRALREVDNRR